MRERLAGAEVIPVAFDASCQTGDWSCTPEIDETAFTRIRARMALDYAKWDPRIGDAETLARFALVLPGSVGRQLSHLAECLAAEAIQAETEILHEPRAIVRLGLPLPIAAVFRKAAARQQAPTPALARVVRFDFHPTADGWRVSEANTDVPGGYAESSEFPRLLADYVPGTSAGHPGDALAKTIVASLGGTARVALISAPGYIDDLQVVTYMAERLRCQGARAFLVQPDQMQWRDRRARIAAGACDEPIDAIFRFYQGEWIAGRGRRPGWECYFVGGLTPACNPGSALLVESKRFSLAWPELRTPLPAWRRLLPECADPRAISGGDFDRWVLKQAYCNTGESVFWPGEPRWRSALWTARLWPSRWVAQRRFQALAIETPLGPMYPCLGVYTIDGRAAGIYGRLAARPLIDYRAIDVAVRIRGEA